MLFDKLTLFKWLTVVPKEFVFSCLWRKSDHPWGERKYCAISLNALYYGSSLLKGSTSDLIQRPTFRSSTSRVSKYITIEATISINISRSRTTCFSGGCTFAGLRARQIFDSSRQTVASTKVSKTSSKCYAESSRNILGRSILAQLY